MNYKSAKMQINKKIDWNDLSFVLAIFRAGTLSLAAKNLRVDQTTVSRRLKTLEQQLGATLFFRKQNRLIPSQAGECLIESAEQVESSISAAIDQIDSADSRCEGKVRITSVPLLMNKILSKNVGLLLKQQPSLELELISSAENFSFSKRQTDLALRFNRPTSGIAVCVKMTNLSYSAYHLKNTQAEQLPWIGYAEERSSLPQSGWLKKHHGKHHQLLVDDAQTALEAVYSGYGRCLFPDYVMKNEANLVCDPTYNNVLTRELWLLIHPQMRHLKRIKVVSAFLKRLFFDLDIKRH